jgi:hypothetical protein
MTRTLLAATLLALVLGTGARAGSPTPDQRLPLRRVVLYSNGVAYFERRGTVTDRAEIALPFKQSQVDDVLKSMVVLDLGRGRIGSVSYESSEPTSARLAEIPFAIEAATAADAEEAGGLAGVLRQLQGARVTVTSATHTVTGAILNVERREVAGEAGKPPTVAAALVVASDAGEITSLRLEEVRSVRLLDENERRDVVEFANATASARRRDVKTIVVTSDGSGAREMVVSYTVAAPIWKTSYRVVFDDAGQPFFQGWAIVDNTSDEDWTGVRLSLVSGSPVSFVQPLQRPLYRHRPVVPIPDDLALEPQVYDPESEDPPGRAGRADDRADGAAVVAAGGAVGRRGLAVAARLAQGDLLLLLGGGGGAGGVGGRAAGGVAGRVAGLGGAADLAALQAAGGAVAGGLLGVAARLALGALGRVVRLGLGRCGGGGLGRLLGQAGALHPADLLDLGGERRGVAAGEAGGRALGRGGDRGGGGRGRGRARGLRRGRRGGCGGRRGGRCGGGGDRRGGRRGGRGVGLVHGLARRLARGRARGLRGGDVERAPARRAAVERGHEQGGDGQAEEGGCTHDGVPRWRGRR